MANNSEQISKLAHTGKHDNKAEVGGESLAENMSEQMSEQMRESLSALMDGEASEMETHRILKAAESRPEVGATWSRYQMVSATIRNNIASGPLVDLSAVIREAVEQEDSLASGKRSWRGGAVKMGIAASVAAVMVFTTQMIGQQSAGFGQEAGTVAVATADGNHRSVTASTQPVSLPAGFQAPNISARAVSSQPGLATRESQPRYYPVVTKAQSARPVSSPSPEVQEYLQRVMEVHAGHAALNSGRGLLPYARVPVSGGDQP